MRVDGVGDRSSDPFVPPYRRVLHSRPRAPSPPGCSPAWPSDRSMCCAGSPGAPRPPGHPGRGPPRCAAVSIWVLLSSSRLSLYTHLTLLHNRTVSLTSLCSLLGWKSGGIHSWGIGFPEFRVASHRLGRVQYYSTAGDDKDGLSKSSANDAPSTGNILSAAGKAAFSSGDKPVTGVHLCFVLFYSRRTTFFPSRDMKLSQLITIVISSDDDPFDLLCHFSASTKQGLTKAETIQVKGNHSCISHYYFCSQ